MTNDHNAGYTACFTAIDESLATLPAILHALPLTFFIGIVMKFPIVPGVLSARGPPADTSDDK